jgi:DNA-binding IclR family transcriptional regulator
MSTADKLLSVLSLFTLEAPRWTVEAAAQQLSVSNSTAYRYFSSLSRAGLLEPISGGLYVLGPAIISFDRQLRIQDPLMQIAQPIMRRLLQRNSGNGVALLCRRFKQQVMCVHQEFEHRPQLAVSYDRGRPMGLYRGAASLIVFASLPTRTQRTIWRANKERMAATRLGQTWDEVRVKLKTLRKQGYCITRGEVDKGMVGIASPVIQPDGTVVGSISIAQPDNESTDVELAGIAALVMAAGHEMNATLANLASADEASADAAHSPG